MLTEIIMWASIVVMACLTSGGIVLLLFRWGGRLRSGMRQAIAAIGAPAVLAGPGLALNYMSGADGGWLYYAIQAGVFFIGSVPTAMVLTRELNRRFGPVATVFQ